MARITCHFFSTTLRVSTAITVLLPEPADGQIGVTGSSSDAPPPVLYLLHGLSDDETIWTRHTSDERYVSKLGLAVVMPRAGRSFYQDEAYGSAYWTFLTEELPEMVQQVLDVVEHDSVERGRGLDRRGEADLLDVVTRPRGEPAIGGRDLHHPREVQVVEAPQGDEVGPRRAVVRLDAVRQRHRVERGAVEHAAVEELDAVRRVPLAERRGQRAREQLQEPLRDDEREAQAHAEQHEAHHNIGDRDGKDGRGHDLSLGPTSPNGERCA